uniref:Uncharacterized protein n=1 Tax=Candidatus Methanogaster sp. ANME-2c ERB4 TaxID=2759911 RepID=A0A7G9YII0_9EURY|nr:hypothetical protein IKJKAPDM_00011 [Methanosarcinales archaeon ANME-2c ERB4]QNO47814.1 hypothetical protein GNFHAPIE_00019 [Methanosarcinales archaeon ANME-2c ERB4]
MKCSDSNGFRGFQSLRPCALASSRSSDLTQSRERRKDEGVTPAISTHVRATAIDHRKRQNQEMFMKLYLFDRAWSLCTTRDYTDFHEISVLILCDLMIRTTT